MKIDFSECRGLFIAPNVDPLVNCVGSSVTATADAIGYAHFAIIGASNNSTGAANPQGFESSAIGCAKGFADGMYGGSYFVPIGRLFVATPDEDNNPAGGQAITGADLSATIGDVAFCSAPSAACFPNCYLNRSDFDQNGAVNGADISKMLDIMVLTGTYNGPSCNFIGTCCPITPP